MAEEYLTGKWRNNLNSETVLNAANGLINGTYQTGVATAAAATLPPPLTVTGRYQQVDDGILLSLSVIWELNINDTKDYSITSWTGKAYFGEFKFKLTWILCRNKTKNSEWENHLVGEDTFVKI
jgi:hypothetical protein